MAKVKIEGGQPVFVSGEGVRLPVDAAAADLTPRRVFAETAA